MLETILHDFSEDNGTWVASKLSGSVGALVAKAIELMNWLICFGYAPEYFRVVVAGLAEWMDNYPPPWADYCSMMSCDIVALDKHPG